MRSRGVPLARGDIALKGVADREREFMCDQQRARSGHQPHSHQVSVTSFFNDLLVLVPPTVIPYDFVNGKVIIIDMQV